MTEKLLKTALNINQSITADVALREYDPKPAVTRWLLSGLRQKRPHTLPYMEPEVETQFLDYAVYLTVTVASFHSMFWNMFTLH